MTLRWLSLALVTLALGCFAQHGNATDDAGVDGSDPDVGPGCFEAPIAFVDALDCPASVSAGEVVTIGVTHTAGMCCASGSARLSVRTEASNQWRIEGSWTVCDCCDGCECVGPVATDTITVGPLEVGTHTVRAGDAECTVRVTGASECAPMMPDTVRAPRVIFEGQDVAFTLTQHDAFGCGCQPQLVRTPHDVFEAQLCDCCEDCMCVDPGYEVAYMGPLFDAPPSGVVLPTERRELASCQRVPATALRVEPPEERVLRDGPAIWWAVVSGMQTVCCVEPTGGVVELAVGAIGTHLDLYSCVDFDCGCVGAPALFEAWHALGELAPGSHLIRAGDHEVSFTVP